MNSKDQGVFATSVKSVQCAGENVDEVTPIFSQQAIVDRMDDPKNPMYTAQELAECFGVEVDVVINWVAEDKLPPPVHQHKGQWYWAANHLLDKLMRMTTLSTFLKASPTLTAEMSVYEAGKLVLKTLIDLTLLKKE